MTYQDAIDQTAHHSIETFQFDGFACTQIQKGDRAYTISQRFGIKLADVIDDIDDHIKELRSFGT